jgi:hypothetical protein
LSQYKRSAYIHAYTLTSINAHTLYPYENLWKTEPAGWILKLTKLSHAPRRWRGCRLPLNKYFAFMRHTDVKPRIWIMMDWGYNHPPNHSTSDWFSVHSNIVEEE